MSAAIARMVRTQSVALVRVWSQWWVAENDLPVRFAEGHTRSPEPVSRRDRDRMAFDKPVFWTVTVHGLVARGKLRFVGGKKRVLSGAKRMDYARAEFRHT